ncbi:MAG: sensor histidine kinase [Lachnospiraceae bacterium]|nr:sensor histidine kinase [Lachnospiraceae bacterium]
MNDSSRLKLQSILTSLETEADPIAMRLEDYHGEISRLEKVLESLMKNVSEADIVFSPRSGKLNEEVKQRQMELDLLKRKCAALQNRYDQINQNIDLLVDVLASDSDVETTKSGLVYQEQDRHRIARDLHDTALQHMSYLVTKLESCKNFIDTDPIKAKMELSIARHNLNESIDEIRGVIYNLRPMAMDSEGFNSAVAKFVQSFNEEKKYEITSDIEDILCDDQLILVTMYRIIEECFSNIKKHAEAYKIHLIIQEQIGLYYIYVEDDGRGFDVDKVFLNDKLQFGLSIMKERVALLGGSVTINSAPNAGTKIKVLIPAPKKN